MCEYCLNSEKEIFEKSEDDIINWKERGKYFGYPKCCIDAFCNRSSFDITPEQEKAIDNHGFVPCQKHATMIIDKKTTLKKLIKKRECKYKYPMDDFDAEVVEFIINSDTELINELDDQDFIL